MNRTDDEEGTPRKNWGHVAFMLFAAFVLLGVESCLSS